jgi:CubicO group peptidase (beta-lactamase class C family)
MNKTVTLILMFISFSAFGFSDENNDQIAVENGLRYPILIANGPNDKMNILDRMENYKAPGVSVAVIDKGSLIWSKGYGNITTNPEAIPVNEHTLFQAGSISKSITAFGALLLVQQGKISLDEDVNVYLKSWKVPENEFTQTEKVTLRRLLSHSAGTCVHGFPGYPVDAPIPSITEILDGNKPLVNTDPVRVIIEPGTEFRYSGGGTTIIQLLIEDITDEHFDAWMKKNVLNPLGMFESTFNQPLSPHHAKIAAYGHLQNGKKVEGDWHLYPEMAAAGLWSTPTDLAKFILYIQSALKQEKTKLLNFDSVKTMITKQRLLDKESLAGLGLFIKYDAEDLVFHHNGRDEGFIASLYGFANRGQGVVIMVNNDCAFGLIEELTNSVADAYGWPNFKPIEKEKIAVDPAIFLSFCGRFIRQGEEIEIRVLAGKLFADFKNGSSSIELHAKSEYLYFMQQGEDVIEFVKPSDAVTELIIINHTKEKTVYIKQ